MSHKEKQKQVSTELGGFYGAVERIGNKIPSPVFMFIGLFIITYIAAFILGSLGVAVESGHRGDGSGSESADRSGSGGIFTENGQRMDELRTSSHGAGVYHRPGGSQP